MTDLGQKIILRLHSEFCPGKHCHPWSDSGRKPQQDADFLSDAIACKAVWGANSVKLPNLRWTSLLAWLCSPHNNWYVPALKSHVYVRQARMWRWVSHRSFPAKKEPLACLACGWAYALWLGRHGDFGSFRVQNHRCCMKSNEFRATLEEFYMSAREVLHKEEQFSRPHSKVSVRLYFS